MSEDEQRRGVRMDPREVLEATRRDPLGREEPRAGLSWFERLVSIMDLLRSPGGCPWDLDQEPRTIKVSVIEEAHEVVEAIESEDPDDLRDELGDLLLQVVFLSRMHKERDDFTVQDVARAVSEKLVRRHPHVFEGARVEGTGEVVANWERIKEQERREKGGEGRKSLMSGLPSSLPGLLKAFRMGQKASRVGFDWKDARGALDELREELSELEEVIEGDDRERLRWEVGDALFSLAQLARKIGLDPEDCAQAANARFLGRFQAMERRMEARGMSWDDVDSEGLDQLWKEAAQAVESSTG